MLCPSRLSSRWRWAALACLLAPAGVGACSGDEDPTPPPVLCISELLYHPVLENAFVDAHEFVEITNPLDTEVDLSGWALADGIGYTFPDGTVLAAGGYLVVARDREALLADGGYVLDPSIVLGNYDRELDNGGELVTLRDEHDQISDSVEYDDDFPWAIGADGLGAGESWLPSSVLPLAAHQYRGISLERVSCGLPGTDPANWVPSSLDGATPGAENTGSREQPLPVVIALATAPDGRSTGTDPLIRESDETRVDVELSQGGAVTGLALEYFVDDLSQTGEPVESVSLASGGGQNYGAVLPAQPDNSIVRYRIVGDRGAGSEVISPRPSDPYAWHAYFVSPELDTASRVYHLFIAPGDWTALYQNIVDGRVDGCATRESWNDRVPAVFVYEGEVFDVQARYHGSRFHRSDGAEMSGWPDAGPSQPNPLLAMSWRVSFPRYHRFESQEVLLLNKLTQGCPGLTAGVGFELFRQAGIPSPNTRYVRLQVNGAYYHYSLEIQHVEADMLASFHEARGDNEPLGHLFKSQGCNCDEGPYGWGDGRLLAADCSFTPAERYQWTYGRKTHEWDSHENLSSLIEGLQDARQQGDATLRSYLGEQFDVDLVLSYLAVMNWSVPFDDMFQNYFLYQRRGDGRWLLIPWDLDQNFGDWLGADGSLFIGEENDPDNRDGWWNYFKDSFFRAYRDEFVARLRQLNESVLQPSNVRALISTMEASMDVAEAEQAPAGLACSMSEAAANFQDFADARHDVVADYTP